MEQGNDPAQPVLPGVNEVSGRKAGGLLVGGGIQPKIQAVELRMSSGHSNQIFSGLSSGTRVFIDLPPWAKKKR